MIRAPAIFLRVGSILPHGLSLTQKSFDEAWMVAEDAAPAHLDLAVRNAGWHFMWIDSECCRRGCGRTDEAASHRAIARALSQTKARFNAAELGVVRISRWLGVRVAKATLHTRHIQENGSLGLIDELTVRLFAPK
ncbi:MAG TPA: hypothetical protein VIY53_10335 [Acidobacteriaceae bacterium]